MNFSEKMQHLRKIHGFSQSELAKRLGVSRQAVYKWESGKSYPDIFRANELLKLYGITLDQLVNDGIDIDENGYAVGVCANETTEPRSPEKEKTGIFGFFKRRRGKH